MSDSADTTDPKASLLSKPEHSPNSKQKSDDLLQSIGFRSMIIFQILAYGSYSILVHLCEKDGAVAFSSTTMNFVLEFTKLIFSFSALFYFSSVHVDVSLSRIQIRSWLKQSLPYSIPGILYFINNNLAVHMQVQMDPASYQILSNFKILTTAILYRIIIKQKLTRRKWFALSLLFFGGLAYSIAVVSAVAKSGSGQIFNPFDGFSFYTWLIVLTQALNGLFMSVVIKHSSNIIRLFVISFSLIVTSFLSWFIFHITFNMYFYVSFLTMGCALSLYYSN
ncbi:unnamed protein product [Rotaria magnacalcarata]